MRPGRIGALLCGLALARGALGASREALVLHHVQLDLPGAPAALLPADLNGDGRRDLLAVVVYTEIDEIGEDRLEGLVQISTVIPAVFDRREARGYLAAADGSYRSAGPPLPLPPAVLSLALGPPGAPLLALTDDGVAQLRWRGGDSPALELLPWIEDRPIVAGTGSFFGRLEWVRDVNGDGAVDVLLPTSTGVALYLAGGGGLARTPAQRVVPPGGVEPAPPGLWKRYALPDVGDRNGDGRPDLSWVSSEGVHLWLGGPGETFRPARPQAADCPLRVLARDGSEAPPLADLAQFLDVDGDGRGEAVVLEAHEEEKEGLRASLKAAKQPRASLRLHRLRDDLALEAEPYATSEIVGHALELESGEEGLNATAARALRDLDDDGRLELVTLTFEFSMLQALRVLATQHIGIGLDFHVWKQEADGRFRQVEGLDLSEKLKLDLNDLSVGRLAQFAGDFDGDRRIDFVHFGRGKTVTIHRGQPGCRYAPRPDLALELGEDPPPLGLVRVEDLDGDGRADLALTRPLPAERPDVTPPVRLELYLSRGPG
ncbi:MAG TPA: VCBS repeat-containing protein [Candidatus Polarisedimenticolaceae bacterium]|nr:VCBS repeat-containing protein [Candidatus Polarisedimenticolaceae bacterium]